MSRTHRLLIVLMLLSAALLSGCSPKEMAKLGPAAGCDLKGHRNSSGVKIYHMPGQRYYDQILPDRWFCSEQQARGAGYRKSKV
jgi:nitrous oxide reductase accessory protein NosL